MTPNRRDDMDRTTQSTIDRTAHALPVGTRRYIALCFMALLPMILAGPSVATAQEGERGLAMQGIYSDGAIRLRWASGSPVTWRLIRTGGITLTRQSAKDSLPVVVGGGPLRVWTEEEWHSRSERIPAAAQVATLLRENERERQGLTEWAEADLEQNKLTSLLLMAEFDFEIARGLALAYRDSDIVADEIYRYEISVRDSVHGDTLRAEAFVRAGEETPLAAPTGLKAGSNDRRIELWWNRTPVHSGYLVERRASGETAWKRLTDHPLIFADNYPNQPLYTDSVLNDRVNEYRVIGVDPFGRESEPSDVVEAAARDLTPPQPPYDVKWELTKKGVRITWKNPSPEPDLVGYGVLRSTNPDENYLPVHPKLLPRSATSYIDTVPGPGTYFYRLISADTAGNLSAMSVRAMAIVEDTVAPPAPVGLMATADTSGVIRLRWRHRPEDDVKGYRVYRMVTGGSKPEFVPITPGAMPDSAFTDTLLATVRDRFFYRVRTVDFAGNYSEPSEAVGVQFPDLLPPAPPVIDDHSTAAGKVRLRYASPSIDVARYEVRRSIGSGATPDIVERTTVGEWTDSTARHGVTYRYVVVAVDSAGNVSAPSSPLFVKPFWTKGLPLPGSPQVALTPSNQVTIRWNFPDTGGWSAIVFRKSQTDGTFLQLSPATKESNYVDTTAKPGHNEYALKFYYPEQGGTQLGATAAIDVPEKKN